jgi:putative transposase
MTAHQAFRYELDPTNVQRSRLASHAGAARYAWNWGLEQIKVALNARATGDLQSHVPDAMQLHRTWNRWKKLPGNCPWWAENSKCAYQEAFRDLERALSIFWRARTAGRRIGFPRFKKKGRGDSFRLTDPVRVEPHAVVLPRLGRIRTKEPTIKLRGRILSATCRREADRWFVSLCVRVERPKVEASLGSAIGVDLGVLTLATLSDGTVIDGRQALERSLTKLRRLNREVARKQRYSKNRAKAAMRLARHHRRIRNRRRDSLHKATTTLARTKSIIVVEDLNVAGMARNRRLGRRVYDQGWAEFRRQLGYKTGWYGSQLMVAPRFYPSSKVCSGCGEAKANLALAERVFGCTACGLQIDRDLNAARNLARLAEHVAASSAETPTPVEREALTLSKPTAWN